MGPMFFFGTRIDYNSRAHVLPKKPSEQTVFDSESIASRANNDYLSLGSPKVEIAVMILDWDVPEDWPEPAAADYSIDKCCLLDERGH